MSSTNAIVVKLIEGAVVDPAALQLFPFVTVESLAPDVDTADLQRMTAEAREADPDSEIADLSLFFAIRFPDEIVSDELLTAAVDQLRQLALVEAAERAVDVVQAGVVPRLMQFYLDDSDTGLRIEPLRNLSGGGGAGVRVAVVDDLDFDRNHPDFQTPGGGLTINALTIQTSTAVTRSINHSTAVLSIVQTVAPDAELLYAGTRRPTESADVPGGAADTGDAFQALVVAALALRAGDVLTCSLVVRGAPMFDTNTGSGIQISGIGSVLLENDFALASLLRLMRARGVIVTLAGGNGVLKRFTHPETREALDLDAHPEVTIRDSGAIAVGGLEPVFHLPPLTPPPKLQRWTFTTFGSRITCCSWAAGIFAATDSATTPGALAFGPVDGTSFATPMIAGGVACVQGISLAKNGSVLSPLQIVGLLQDSNLGIDWAPGGGVGLLPQFDKIAGQI